jgi:hypothetical protein
MPKPSLLLLLAMRRKARAMLAPPLAPRRPLSTRPMLSKKERRRDSHNSRLLPRRRED